MNLIKQFGEMWARNPKNINKIPGSAEGGQGVYILYYGSMPVYIGKGNIRGRIRRAKKSISKGQMWDRFSWYIPSSPKHMHDLEVLLLRMLPWNLHGLNRQSGHFRGAHGIKQAHDNPEPIKSPKVLSKKRKRN